MHIVIVGNGIAGINAARSLVRPGAESGVQIDMFTDEPYLYYPRPQLPFYLAGEVTAEDLIQYPAQWYERRGIDMHLQERIVALDPAGKSVTTATGKRVSYDRLLLANGSRPNIPPFKGVDKAGVFTLRSMEDAQVIQDYARQVDRAIVIGGGLLGLETARALRVLGPQVHILELFPRLLPIQLDDMGAEVLQEQLEANGLTISTSATTETVLGTDAPTGVRLADGREIAGQMVVISAGIRSNIQLATDAGLEANRGLLVDQTMRTSAEDIYAAGDVAEFNGRVWGIVPAAVEQSRVAAANMVSADGAAETYVDIVPSNTLKVVGIDLTAIGIVNPEGEGFQEVRYIDREAGRYEKLVLKDGRIVGAILFGSREKVGAVTALITQRADVSLHLSELLQPGFNLKSLLQT